MEEGDSNLNAPKDTTSPSIITENNVSNFPKPDEGIIDGKKDGAFSIEDLANVAAGSSPLGKEREEQKKRFDALCRGLNVDEETKNKAWEFLNRIPAEDNSPEHENYWNACALYIAGSKRLNGRANGVSLSHLLRDTGIRMVDFFDPMKSFITLLQLGSTIEDQLKILEKKFVVITILFQKYERVFGDLLQLPTPSDRIQTRGKKSDAFQIFCFGWNLFLVAKGKLLLDPPDLLNAYHLLLCCLNLLLTHVPPHLRRLSFKEPNFVKDNNGNQPVNTLSYLCEISNANYNDVNNIQEQLFVPFLQMLSKNGSLKVNSAKVPTEPSLAKCFYLGGLLEINLQKNKSSINKEYEKMYYDHGDFDERLFIDQIEQIGTPSKVTSQTRNYYHLNNLKSNTVNPLEQVNSFASPYKHSLHSQNPHLSSGLSIQSPMTTTLSTVTWLKDTVKNFDAEPTPTLLRFFKACNKDITTEVTDRVHKLIEMIPVLEAESEWAEKPRIDSGVKLYYRILESMLLAEEQRLRQDNFTNLLSHENFHKSLLACCIEVVLFSYKMNHMAFPYILNKFNLKPFDFCKIIESVVRHASDLPKVVVKHMCSIEERILESLAWEEGSPLITMIKEHKFQIPVPNQNQNFISSSSNSNNLFSPAPKINNNTLTVNNNNSNPNHISNLASPMPKKQVNGDKKPISHTLELFYRKVYHLANIRSRELCSRLDINVKIYSQVWQAITHILQDPLCLLCNRHLDQIIMSSIYGVSRVNQLGITFRQIIDQYRQQPQANSKIFREVTLTKPEERGDIINFYNSTFIPSMEQFILQFQQNSLNESKENGNSIVPTVNTSISSLNGIGSPLPNELAKRNSFSSLVGQSPKRTPSSGSNGTTSISNSSSSNANNNLYLSPMRLQSRPSTPGQSYSQSHVTGQTNSLISNSASKFSYSFGESPAKELQQINQSINTATPKHKTKPIKRLFSDNGQNSAPLTESNLKRKFDEDAVANEKENENNQKFSRQ